MQLFRAFTFCQHNFRFRLGHSFSSSSSFFPIRVRARAVFDDTKTKSVASAYLKNGDKVSIRHWQCISSCLFSSLLSFALSRSVYIFDTTWIVFVCSVCFVLVSIRVFFFSSSILLVSNTRLPFHLSKCTFGFVKIELTLINFIFIIANFFCVASFEFRFKRNNLATANVPKATKERERERDRERKQERPLSKARFAETQLIW